MKRRKGGRTGGIEIEDLMIKCRQNWWGGSDGAESDNIRTLNA